MANSIVIDAVFEGGVFRPKKPVTADLPHTVQLIVKIPGQARAWPSNVAEIYQELADDDRKLANAMWQDVTRTWPTEGP